MACRCIQWGMENILYCYYVKEGTGETAKKSCDEASRNVRVTILQEFVADYPVYYAGIYVPEEYENMNKSQKLTFLKEAAGEIAKAMRHMMKQDDSCFLVYHPKFEDWLRRQGSLGWWKAMLGVEEFEGFLRVLNLPIILSHIQEWKSMKQVMVLGCPKGMIPLLPDLVENAASMEVYVSSEPDQDLMEQFEQVAQTILDEYGLCPQILPWKKKALSSDYPALVIDFMPERNSPGGLADGSLWVDMVGSGSKEYFLGEDSGKVQYFSLKRIWWKEIQQTLDTIGKIKYNTQS